MRGSVDAFFIEKMKAAWQGERWYSIANLEDIFPEPLGILGSGDTQEELESDLADIMSHWKGHIVGFGEHPFDMGDWAVRHHVEVIETTIGKPNRRDPIYRKHNMLFSASSPAQQSVAVGSAYNGAKTTTDSTRLGAQFTNKRNRSAGWIDVLAGGVWHGRK